VEGIVFKAGLPALRFADSHQMVPVDKVQSGQFATGCGKLFQQGAGEVHQWDKFQILQGVRCDFQGQMVTAKLVHPHVPKPGQLPHEPVGGAFGSLQLRSNFTGAVDTSTTFTNGDIRNRVPRFNQENLAANQALVTHVSDLARAKDAAPAQIALAWLLAQQPWIVPIPGTRGTARIKENAAATQVALSADEIADLNTLAQRLGVHDDRYNTTHMSYVNR
jgi:hypothetical protein